MSPRASVAGPTADGHPDAERRQLTVLFCDLVAYTPLASALDPEDLRDLVAGYHRICGEAIRRFDGHVAQYLGDGILAYFGFPEAHEDDPLRAIDAGLAIIAELRAQGDRLLGAIPGSPRDALRVRVGIHTGAVVVGELGTEQLAVGETVNLAARLETLAESQSVVISAATARFADGFFALETLGATAVKGFAQPVQLYRALHRTDARNRVEIGLHRGLTPFVGRASQLAALGESWRALGKSEGGSLVHVCGEPGMGKTRLIQHFRTIVSTGASWFECGCSSSHQNTALFPIIAMIERELRFAEIESADDRLARLEAALTAVGLGDDEAVPLLADLLSLPTPERNRLPPLSADVRRRRTIDALLRWLFCAAARGPTALIVEDLHWADPSTLEVIEALVARLGEVPLLVIGTARPEFVAPWSGRPGIELLDLEPLDRQHVRSIVSEIMMGRALPFELGELLVSRTDGVPLFVEELAKSVFESLRGRHLAPGESLDAHVPSTLEGSLLARLDRLGDAKGIAQLAAVVGRSFSRALVARIHDGDAAAVSAAFERLLDAGLILPAPADASGERLHFKHALIQEAAYQSLLRSRRRDLHARIARALEQYFPAQVETQREVLAHHYEHAHELERAAHEYRRAGECAMQRSAHREAVNHYTRGIELLRALPASEQRDASELDLQVSLGTPLQALLGFSHPDVERTYSRARELSGAGGDPVRLFQARSGLLLYYQTRGDLAVAAELADEIEADADRAGDPYLRQWVHLFHGVPLYYWGRFQEAARHLERAVALYDPNFDPERYFHVQDPGVAAGSMAAMALWMVGRPDLGLVRANQAIERGRTSRHPYNLAFALAVSTSFHIMRREPARVRERSDEVTRVAQEQGFPVWSGMGLAARAWADAVEGDHTATERIWEGIEVSARTGMRLAGPLMVGLVADARLHAGNFQGAVHAADSALALSSRNGDHFWDAELLRIRGEALLGGAGDRASARASLDSALALARAQGARALELRSLQSSLRFSDDADEVRSLDAHLSEILTEYSEGQGTPDLVAAQSLLTARRHDATPH